MKKQNVSLESFTAKQRIHAFGFMIFKSILGTKTEHKSIPENRTTNHKFFSNL
jgi:hypothetical protein